MNAKPWCLFNGKEELESTTLPTLPTSTDVPGGEWMVCEYQVSKDQWNGVTASRAPRNTLCYYNKGKDVRKNEWLLGLGTYLYYTIACEVSCLTRVPTPMSDELCSCWHPNCFTGPSVSDTSFLCLEILEIHVQCTDCDQFTPSGPACKASVERLVTSMLVGLFSPRTKRTRSPNLIFLIVEIVWPIRTLSANCRVYAVVSAI